jgi:hypothetical protein
MFTDPAAAAWHTAGRPAVDAPTPIPGRCGRCGTTTDTVTSSRIISEKFTGFDAWPYGSRRLCVPCAWAYTCTPTTQQPMLITTTTTTTFTAGGELAPHLSAGALAPTAAAILPTVKRRHLLPTARWGHMATDGLVIIWDHHAAHRLTDLMWLRADLGATWPQLQHPAPRADLVRNQPPHLWERILAAWSGVQPWRAIPPLWAAARILTNPPPT